MQHEPRDFYNPDIVFTEEYELESLNLIQVNFRL
jgi:hypothetical protein